MTDHKASCMIVALVWAFLLAMPVLAHTESNPATFPLVYGNTEIQIGWVKVWNDDNLHVEFEITTPEWGIEETHVLVTLTSIAWTNAPGQYTYQHTFTPPGYPTADVYVIGEIGHGPYGEDDPKLPVSGLSECTIVYIIAHTAVVGPTGQQETAFGNSFRDADTVIEYHIQRENGPPPGIPTLPMFAFPAGLGIVGLTYLWRRKTG